MGKRSHFERNPRDFYPTPFEAVNPLFIHLPIEDCYDNRKTFCEPCAGDGQLADFLSIQMKVHSLFDIEPQRHDIRQLNTLYLGCDPFIEKNKPDYIITNPPWDRKLLHPMIDSWRQIAPTWLLFDADWMHTKQSSEYIKYCKKIVSVGRVKWIPDSKMTGKDNCAWYLFVDHECKTEFVGR